MKKIAYLIVILFLLAIISACQKTPDSPIVIGKDIDNIIDKAVEDPVVVSPDSGEDLRKPLDAPEILKLETEGVKGNLKIYVDADVIVPNTASIPVARVTRGQFSEEDVKNLYKVFHGDAKPIDPDAPPSSTYYMESVQELQKRKESGEYDDKLLDDEGIDDQIKDLLKQAAEAPESYEEVEPDFTFKENKDEDKGPLGLYARLKFMSDDNIISEINVIQDTYGTGAYAEYIRDNTKSNEINDMVVGYSDAYSGNVEIGILPTIKEEDAQKLAQDTVTKLGLTDFVCTGKRVTPTSQLEYGEPIEIRGVYEFMFTRKINGVPINYTNDEGLTTVHEAYHQPWMYEKIRIFIDDQGIVYLKWSSPYIMKEIVSEASAMLPFSDISDIFKRMAPMKYDYCDNDEGYSYEMKVTEARLGLMRVTEKDVGDSGLIIPVWDFFGTLTLKGKPRQPNPAQGDQHYVYTSFLTINAIDGSIIDRELGY